MIQSSRFDPGRSTWVGGGRFRHHAISTRHTMLAVNCLAILIDLSVFASKNLRVGKTLNGAERLGGTL